MKLKMSKEVDLGKEPIGHLLFVLAVPSIISQVVNALYNMVDRMYIGHIPGEGAAALTGLGVCFPVIMIVSAFAALMGMGGAPRASILMGKKDNEGRQCSPGACRPGRPRAGRASPCRGEGWRRSPHRRWSRRGAAPPRRGRSVPARRATAASGRPGRPARG